MRPKLRTVPALALLAILALAGVAGAARAGAPDRPTLEGGSGSTDFAINLLPGGTEIEYSGRIAFGASGALRSALNDHPSVKILHLNSKGGSVGDARQLQYLVQDRGLTTVVDAQCLSACTLVFLAGVERYMTPGAKLGFHREKAMGASQAEINMFEETDAQHMLALGISSSFVDKAFSTPSSDMWIPTVEELKAGHVITDVSTKFAMPEDARLPANLAEQLLAEDPFKGLQARDPDRYKALRDRVLVAMAGFTSEPDIEPLPTPDIAPLSLIYFSHASDNLVIEFAQALQSYLGKLGRTNPDECYFILYPNRAPAGVSTSEVFTGSELEDFADLQVRLVGDAALRKAAIPSEGEIVAARAALVKQIREKDPGMASTWSNLDSPTLDHGVVCTAITEMLATIQTLPYAQRGPLLRYLFSSS
jgi:hypothetical protein